MKAYSTLHKRSTRRPRRISPARPQAGPRNTGEKCFTPELREGLPEDRRVSRWTAQGWAAELLPDQAVARCCRHMHGHTVDVKHHKATGSASFSGLVTCASVWHCPVCAAKISERRRLELRAAIEAAEAQGLTVLMVTWTVRHKRGDSLPELLEGLRQARKRMRSGKVAAAWSKRYGLVGSVRALEVTTGENGWHPHVHELLFLDCSELDLDQVERELQQRWGAAVQAAGLREVTHHGCKVAWSGTAEGQLSIAEYVAKHGQERSWDRAEELTKAAVKRGNKQGRTPAQLLADYGCGDEQAGGLWQHYARSFKGERQLYWSPGLRAALGLGKEQSDKEVAAEEQAGGEQLAVLEAHEWAVVIGNDLRGELLHAAALGSVRDLEAWLWRVGIRKTCLAYVAGGDESEGDDG